MIHWHRYLGAALAVCFICASGWCDDVTIRIDANSPVRPVSRYLMGACIEDVNHEIYGGIYSQMIFGESFQEPPRSEPVTGFVTIDGEWSAKDGEVTGGEGQGPKLVSTAPPLASGQVGVEVYFPGTAPGNAGLIVKVDKAGAGADNFDGYEVSIDVARKVASLSRHHHDWKLLKETPCDIAPDRWIALSAKMTGQSLDISVDGKSLIQFEDREQPLAAGGVGLRGWLRPARYRRLWIDPGTGRVELPFIANPGEPSRLSGMWRAIRSGSAQLSLDVEKDRAFVGSQSQRVTFTSGEGEAGIENQGLNRQGMGFVAGKPYEGFLRVRSEKPVDIWVSLESRDGAKQYAESRLSVVGEDSWQRIHFTLTPNAQDAAGRFAIRLKSPGSIVVGHVFLQPGEWDRFKRLPLRRDVVEGMIDQGISVLRYGGSMVNAPEYRWKKMIGPRDRRPPYKGTWYPFSSNGWGITDFLDLCEAAGFLGVPDFNMDETPQDLADFIEYVNGTADSGWSAKRSDGHPKPYGLTHIELGNEERIDDKYFEKFAPIAKAIWAKDPAIILVVGDFAYNHPILDPMKFTGADSRVTSLETHRRILELARQNHREVWFDVHIWTDGPTASNSLKALSSYVDALEKISGGAKHRVVVFELNANNPRQRRALANAWAINSIARDGRLPIVASANGLQPDRQNDNGWDQGLLFLNPTQVWLQPPGYITRMMARNYQPGLLNVEVDGSKDMLDVTATRSEDGKTLVLQVVNLDDKPRSSELHLTGFTPSDPLAQIEELAGPLDAQNTAKEPLRIVPRQFEWRHEMRDAVARYSFPAHSFTIIRLK